MMSSATAGRMVGSAGPCSPHASARLSRLRRHRGHGGGRDEDSTIGPGKTGISRPSHTRPDGSPANPVERHGEKGCARRPQYAPTRQASWPRWAEVYVANPRALGGTKPHRRPAGRSPTLAALHSVDAGRRYAREAAEGSRPGLIKGPFPESSPESGGRGRGP